MEQQENQYDIESKEKTKNKIFFTGMFWGFLVVFLHVVVLE